MEFENIVIGLCGIAGLAIASYIYHNKRKNVVMSCPLKGNCHAVITSKYSKFLGIPVEILGMAYYSLIVGGYILFSFVPAVSSEIVASFITTITVVAFLFSMYLMYIQFSKLKQWCTWCVISASLCTIIFLFTLQKIDVLQLWQM